MAKEKEYIDVVIVVPLFEEHDELRAVFEVKKEHQDSTFVVIEWKHRLSNVRVVSVLQRKQGKIACREAVQYMSSKFDFGVCIVYGIAGSLSDDNRLGDVCYADEIIDVIEGNSIKEGLKGSVSIDFTPSHYDPNKVLVHSLHSFRNSMKSSESFGSWIKDCCAFKEKLFDDFQSNEHVRQQLSHQITARQGPIFCGPVVKSVGYKADLKKINRQAMAVETESSGAYEALSGSHLCKNIITVRGISDNADHKKNQLEKDANGITRKIAAYNAALFIKNLIHTETFISAVQSLNAPELPLSESQSRNIVPLNPLQSEIRRLQTDIEGRLSDLSSEYKLKPDGYMLPPPRLSPIYIDEPDVDSDEYSFRDLIDVVHDASVTWIVLENSYPDESLPWIIAHNLLGKDADGGVYLPVVLEGAAIGPPRGTVANLTESYNFNALKGDHSCVPVIIISEPNISTPNRKKYLQEQIVHYNQGNQGNQGKIIIVSRHQERLIEYDEIVSEIGGRLYNVDRVSFQELTAFLIKSFKMESPQAQVIARRLDSVFERFDLLAHPAYFAGIPENMLMALLQANRRSELIQLAVDGHLTFVVAGDEASIPLSRTTRQTFLQNFAFDVNVEKDVISKIELVKRADDFAKEYAYPINPISFVEDFFKFGILRESGDHVEFALPYFEHYLLALEIAQRPGDVERRYFDIASGDMDLVTFDLYCEMSKSSGVVDSLFDCLDASIKDLSELFPAKHVLTTSELDRIALSWPRYVQGTTDRIKVAQSRIEAAADDAPQKQAELDLLREGRRRVARRSKEAIGISDSGGHASDEDDIDEGVLIRTRALFNLRAAVVAVGAGAERFDAKTKTDLVERVLNLSSLVLHGWLTDIKDVSAEDMAEDIRNSRLYEKLAADKTGEDLRKLEEAIDQFSEFLVIALLFKPWGIVMYYLSEFGKHKVLSSTIASYEAESEIAKIIKGVWLTDIDTRQGIGVLKKIFRAAKFSTFMRIAVANRIGHGVYWDHYEKKSQLGLLNLAKKILSPKKLGITLDTEKIAQKKNLYRKNLSSKRTRTKKTH